LICLREIVGAAIIATTSTYQRAKLAFGLGTKVTPVLRLRHNIVMAVLPMHLNLIMGLSLAIIILRYRYDMFFNAFVVCPSW
jgi:hypothetical protein